MALSPLPASASRVRLCKRLTISPREMRAHAALAARVWRVSLCGALLAMAGALLQVLLRNPLAEPYVLGVSGGAATLRARSR